MSFTETPAPPPVPALPENVIADILDQAVSRYAESRRQQIPDFVSRTYGWRGAFGIHRKALGWDLLRAPANLVLSGATGVARLGGVAARSVGARQIGDRLGRFQMILDTDVGREVAWRVHSDLLMIPYQQPGRSTLADALFDEITQDTRVTAHLDKVVAAIAAESDKRAYQARLDRVLSEYIGQRAPATDIAAALMTASLGYAAYHKVTPGLISLSSTVAGSLAQTIAVSSFWAGPTAGSVYYAVAGVPAASTLLTAGVFAGLTVPAAALTALAGLVADPIQASTGLHHRRLRRLIDTLEHNLKFDHERRLPLRSHYTARLVDLWDWTTVAYNLTANAGLK
ncbi:MAG: hypothetical protein RIF37_17220 [Rhodospirillaceae bacterium]